MCVDDNGSRIYKYIDFCFSYAFRLWFYVCVTYVVVDRCSLSVDKKTDCWFLIKAIVYIYSHFSLANKNRLFVLGNFQKLLSDYDLYTVFFFALFIYIPNLFHMTRFFNVFSQLYFHMCLRGCFEKEV